MATIIRIPDRSTVGHVIVVPLKQFDLAKERLRIEGAQDVTALAERLAANVLAHCLPLRVIVLSESDSVSEFASRHGAEVWRSTSRSLNEAVQRAYQDLGTRFDRITIVHGDLRDPEGLGQFEPEAGVTIFTDHRGDGTNVFSLPTGLDFRFAYGHRSARAHDREVRRLRVPGRVISNSPWRFDVDEVSDLTGPPDGI